MQTQSHSPWMVWILASTGFLAGCGGGALLQQKDEEISRLSQDLAFKQQLLDQARERVSGLQKQIKAMGESTESSADRLARVQQELKEYKEKYEQLSVERVKLESRSVEWERSYENIKKKLSDVQQVAASTAEELADLRLRTKDSRARAEYIEKNNATLRDENSQLRNRLAALSNKLKASEVVVATLKGKGNRPDLSQDRERELANQIVTLEREVTNLTKERNALHLKISNIEERIRQKLPQKKGIEILNPEGASESVVGDSKGLYYNDPKGLWMEAVGLVAGRVGAMVDRRARWDALDIGLVTAGSVLLIGLIWLITTPWRWRRRRRLKRELKRLRARMATGGVREAVEASGEPAAARARRARRSGSVVRRTNQFSPILSADDLGADEEDTTYHEQNEGFELPEEAFAAGDESAESVAPAGATHSHGGAARGSMVIGAHQWDDSDDTDDLAESNEEEDEFVNTQVIPSVDEFGLEEERIRSVRDPLRRRAAEEAASPAAEPQPVQQQDEEEEDEFGNTQIIPGLHELEGLEEESAAAAENAASPPEKKKKEDGQDLLSELEDLIGKKVDEMI